MGVRTTNAIFILSYNNNYHPSHSPPFRRRGPLTLRLPQPHEPPAILVFSHNRLLASRCPHRPSRCPRLDLLHQPTQSQPPHCALVHTPQASTLFPSGTLTNPNSPHRLSKFTPRLFLIPLETQSGYPFLQRYYCISFPYFSSPSLFPIQLVSCSSKWVLVLIASFLGYMLSLLSSFFLRYL